MRSISLSISLLSVGLCLGCGGAQPGPLPDACAATLAQMPASWRPDIPLDPAPWTGAEEAAATAAAEAGLDELVGWFRVAPERVDAVGYDAVESVLDLSYAAHRPEIRALDLAQAAAALARLAAEPLSRAPGGERCEDAGDLLTAAVYAQLLWGDAPRRHHLVALANGALDACGTLDAGVRPRRFEPIVAGGYGARVRAILKSARRPR